MFSTAAWAVFGAARRWFQTPDRVPAEEMAAKIETMVRSIFLTASQWLQSGNAGHSDSSFSFGENA